MVFNRQNFCYTKLFSNVAIFNMFFYKGLPTLFSGISENGTPRKTHEWHCGVCRSPIFLKIMQISSQLVAKKPTGPAIYCWSLVGDFPVGDLRGNRRGEPRALKKKNFLYIIFVFETQLLLKSDINLHFFSNLINL